eukprot:CAMPEP_0116058570 /NCGR_PEP_ID=MMETSP0322-20121206/5273_1 /TAXON_ID=163516 /ORGANISM="Leptocylindrus danicus var. apora, Strain B651" /LENGTH=250 /DNA_ID=CAMNT_0003542773 /DNA_START=797 /DNA_END=1546 /DNA_ORIENTATION=+
MRSSIVQFESFYKSSRGKKEFQGTNSKFPELTTEKWALIRGLRMLLKPFDSVTKYLSGEKYPSYTAAMPILREVKGILSNTTLFDMSDRACTNKKFKLNFKRDFSEYPFFERVVNLLEECRIFLLEEFTKRFTDVDASILWSSLLDPRFASATYLSGPEIYKAKYLLQNEVLYLVMQDWVAEPDGEIFNTGTDINSDDSDEDNDVDFILKLTESRIPKATNNDKSPETRRQDQMERERIAVKHEVEAYIR